MGVRVFTGSVVRGRPTQLSRTVRGGKRDVLDEWVKQNIDTWRRRRRVISRAA